MPKLFHTTRIKVKHGLIVIKDENGPEGLKVKWVYVKLDWVAVFLCASCILWPFEALFGHNEGAV